ncbi:ADP-ribosyltransferase [Clostridium botulinum]|uniref:ADP-ribosyltransferase n=1 Tax=Clostridium botulinum TaxID=1491 RepID=UPI000947819F|nr:ADP-ribosyltransferase [Clostridium botulinum]APQ77028.1 ADP-ribosyltransferase exoenzyme family protein [Clostridium botulinum]
MNRKKVISLVLLTSIVSSNIGYTRTVLAKDSNFKHTNISTTMNSPGEGDSVDFKEDKEKAKEWGKEKAKEWNLAYTERQNIRDYLNDKGSIKTNYNEIIFSKGEDFLSEKDKLKSIEKGLNKAKLSDTVVTYKHVDPKSIGFNGELFKGNDINHKEFGEFKEQFLYDENKKNYIKPDGFFETNISDPGISPTEHQNRVILKVKVPSSKGRDNPTKAGVFLDGEEYKMLISNDYVIKVDDMHHSTLKGRDYVVVDGTLERSLDFKNDLNGLAKEWGEKNYEKWENELSAEERAALIGYIKGWEYKAINEYLRTGKLPSESESLHDEGKMKDRIEKISQSLGKELIPENITVYRRSGAPEYGYEKGKVINMEQFQKDFLNKDKLEKGFLSTSLSSKDVGAFKDSPIILRLQVPKGYKGAYVSNLIEGYDEKEILLDKGSKYHINRISKTTIKGKDMYIVDATLLSR